MLLNLGLEVKDRASKGMGAAGTVLCWLEGDGSFHKFYSCRELNSSKAWMNLDEEPECQMRQKSQSTFCTI
jgi:hypothetical protein